MLKIYVSSTFLDLKDYRGVVIETLEQLEYQARAMERYVAADERPLDMCLADVAQCDLYIGIVAWRYGFIPQENNPEGRSITECELREAMRLGKECLLFLSDQQPGKWLSETEEDYTHAKRLREYIEREHTVRYF